MFNLTIELALEKWNEEIASTLLPNTALSVLFLVAGIIGNVMTIVVYVTCMKITDERFFIPVLAVIDLLASSCCSSFIIVQQRIKVNFTNEILCKTIWFVGGFFTFLSITVLLLISVQRYIKVCQPFKLRITRRILLVWLFLGIVVTILMSTPTVLFYGLVETSNTNLNITGLQCNRHTNGNRIVFLLYGICIAVFVVIAILLLIFFYGKIAFKLFTHYKNISTFSNEWRERKKRCTDNNMCTTVTYQIRTSEGNTVKTMKTKYTEGNSISAKGTEKNTIRVKGIENNNLRPIGKDNRDRKKIPSRVMCNTSYKLKHKLTFTFMVITSIFILCYTSKLIILILEGLNETLWENLTTSSLNGLMFGSQFFILNNVINPYVYAFMDTKFQKALKRMLKYIKVN